MIYARNRIIFCIFVRVLEYYFTCNSASFRILTEIHTLSLAKFDFSEFFAF